MRPTLHFSGGDWVLYGSVILCVLIGLAGQPLWTASDSRIVVWASWHDALQSDERQDPWGHAFVEADNPADSLAFARDSLAYVESLRD